MTALELNLRMAVFTFLILLGPSAGIFFFWYKIKQFKYVLTLGVLLDLATTGVILYHFS